MRRLFLFILLLLAEPVTAFQTEPADASAGRTSIGASGTQEPAGLSGLGAWIDAVLARRDDADPAMIERIAATETREALDGLLQAYDRMASLFMRREVLRGLARFDAVTGLEQLALQKILDAATLSSERELRLIALELLAECPLYGKAFLSMAVEAPTDDEVRELAMRYHTREPDAEDLGWYEELFLGKGNHERNRARRRKGMEERLPPRLPVIRQLAFTALAPSLSRAKLSAALGDRQQAVREAARRELARRGDSLALRAAKDALQARTLSDGERLTAARLLAQIEGADWASEFLEHARRDDSSYAFALGLAEIVSGLFAAEKDEERARSLGAELLRYAGKGEDRQRIVSLRAAETLTDPKYEQLLVRLLRARDAHIRREVLRQFAHRPRASPEAIAAVEALLEDARGQELGAALVALSAMRKGDPAWTDRLIGYVLHETPDVRNASLRALAGTGDDRVLRVLAELLHHPAWSTRLAAARGLEELRMPAGVGALALRMPQELGRMTVEFGEILFRLTGRPFGNNGRSWEGWWRNEGAGFELPGPAELRQLRTEREERRLREVTRSSFFGIRVESHRVAFVLDVSGSMSELTRGRYVDEEGDARIERAKKELIQALASLDRRSLFNVLTFHDEVVPWRERISPNDDRNLEDVRGFVADLGPGGGTNLFAALRAAFADPEVDTIFVLSDGEPTVGDVIDPGRIRSEVARWNENRGVILHTIAVGGSLSILEWLAEDSGGVHVRFP